jgi:uncharacterized protein YjbI with pentapeptide repeats
VPSEYVFAGKKAFGSDGTAPRLWLTVAEFESDAAETITLPVVRATSAGYDQRVIAYARSGGGMLLQMVRVRGGVAERWWLSLIRALGWIGLVPESEPQNAAAFELETSAGGTLLTLLDGAKRPVSYTTGASGILTVTTPAGRAFVAERATPSLAEIRASGGNGADLGDVDLRGESLAGVTLAGASFLRGSLQQTVFDNADLTGAVFTGAALEATSFAAATLDRASFSATTVAATRWNAPKSARGIVLAGCNGAGMRLGIPNARALLDASGADLSGADLRGAVLDRIDFTGANLTGALIGAGASAVKAVFDGALLGGAVGSYGSFGEALFRRARGAGAVFAGADLRGAVLDGAQFGTKTLLFGLDRTFAAELDRDRYPSKALVGAFTSHGAKITGLSEITVVIPARRWRIAGTETTYDIADPGGPAPLDVFDSAGSVAPAVFAGAQLDDAHALGAGLSGTDFSGAKWRGISASLANADCTGATFAGAEIVDADLTQALLDGATFSQAVLIGAKIGGARIRFVPGGRRPSFADALVLGARFDAALIVDAVFAGAWVALEDGVPLVRLAASAWDELAAGRFEPVRTAIAAGGYALSSSTRFTAVDRWFVANLGSGGDKSVSTFAVERAKTSRKEYAVYDRDRGTFLFRLDAGVTLPPSGAVPAAVRSAFRAHDRPLGDDSTIERNDLWWADDPAPPPQRVRFRTLTLTRSGAGPVDVAGAITVTFAERGVDEVAFAVTAKLTGNAETVTANGFTRRANERAGLDAFAQMMRRLRS